MKLRLFFKSLLFVLAGIILVFIVLQIIPPKKANLINPFLKQDETKVCISTENGDFGPSNTLVAFNNAINAGCDMIKVSLCLTKDEKVICNDKLNLNFNTDVNLLCGYENYYISDHTLEEISVLNFGYNYDEYKDNKINVCEINDLISTYKDTDVMFMFEILDDLARGEKVLEILSDLIINNRLKSRSIITSNYKDNIKVVDNKFVDYFRTSLLSENNTFFASTLFGINIFFNDSYDVMLANYEENISIFNLLNLNIKTYKANYYNRLHRRNIALFINCNDESVLNDEMLKNCDLICTNNLNVLNKIKNF